MFKNHNNGNRKLIMKKPNILSRVVLPPSIDKISYKGVSVRAGNIFVSKISDFPGQPELCIEMLYAENNQAQKLNYFKSDTNLINI